MLATDRALGRWPEILSAAGVPDEYLSKRHGPCPFCGGRDRFRFADKGKGLWVCSGCTNDEYKSGMQFLMNIQGLGIATFKDAAAYVYRYLDGAGVASATLNTVFDTQDLTAQREFRTKKMQQLLASTLPVLEGDPVWLYLNRRVPGINHVPGGIRFHTGLEYYEAAPAGHKPPYRSLGTYPAMIVPGYDVEGRLVQIHKTYLTSDGQKANVPNPKKTDVGVGCNAFALRMMDFAEGDLGVSEGVETGLAGSVLYNGIPVWSCHCASVLARFEVPESLRSKVRRLIIFMDNDPPKFRKDGTVWRAGREAAAAVSATARKQGIRTLIVKSPKVGTDKVDTAHHANRSLGTRKQ